MAGVGLWGVDAAESAFGRGGRAGCPTLDLVGRQMRGCSSRSLSWRLARRCAKLRACEGKGLELDCGWHCLATAVDWRLVCGWHCLWGVDAAESAFACTGGAAGILSARQGVAANGFGLTRPSSVAQFIATCWL